MKKFTTLAVMVCFTLFTFGQKTTTLVNDYGKTRAEISVSSAKSGAKSLTVEISPSTRYLAESTMKIYFSLTLATPDLEYGDLLEMTFPTGIVPIDGQDPFAVATENQGDEVLNPIDGQTISWGDDDNSWGGIEPGTHEFWVEVTIAAGITGDQVVDFHMSGDEYGAAPNFFDGTTTLKEMPIVPDLAIMSSGFLAEYYAIPLEQAVFGQVSSTLIQATVYNFGTDLSEATNATVESGDYMDEVAIDLPLLSNEMQQIVFDSYTITELGEAKFMYEANASDDADATNGMDSASIIVNETDLIRDNGEIAGYFGVGSGGGDYLGNVFTIASKDTLNSVLLSLGAATLGDVLAIDIFNMVDGVPGTLVASSIDLVVTGQDQEFAAYFPGEGLILEAGEYLFAVKEDVNNMSLAYTTTSFVESSAWVFYQDAWQDMGTMGYPHTYFIRPQFGTELPEFDMEMGDLTMYKYAIKGDELAITGKLINKGVDALTSIDISYTVNAGEAVTESFTGLNGYGIIEFELATPVALDAVGDYAIKVYLSNPNGAPDSNPDNDATETLVSALEYAAPKAIIGEEATGTWCGWCTRGHVFMEYMEVMYPETWIGIAVHNGDPMVVQEYDAAIGGYIGGYPSGLVNRMGEYDPSAFEAAYLEMIALPSPVAPSIENIVLNGLELSFDVSAEFLATIEGAKFNAVIKEAHVTGSGNGWDQANYYSGGGSGEMGGYEDMPNPVPAADMIYEDVARAILGGWDGTEGSISSSVAAGTTESHTYTITLDEGWDIEKLEIVGMVIAEDGSILNAVAEEIAVEPSVAITFNVDMTGAEGFDASVDVVYVTGAFAGPSGWDEPGTGESVMLTDADGDMVYTGIGSAPENDSVAYKYFINANWNTGDPAGDRYAMTTDVDIVIDPADVWGDTGTGIALNNLNQVSMYPNPFSETLSINNLSSVNEIVILNLVGQTVKAIAVTDNNMIINTSDLEDGIYMITIIDENNNIRTERMVKH